MTTASDAYGVIRSVIEANVPNDQNGRPIDLRFYGDQAPLLPSIPQPFAFILFDASRASVIEVGGGRGANRHRNPGIAAIYLFVPQDWTLKVATDLAESIATLFRSYRQNGVSCESATVYPGGLGSQMKPPGTDSEVDNYMWACCEIEFYFDLTG